MLDTELSVKDPEHMKPTGFLPFWKSVGEIAIQLITPLIWKCLCAGIRLRVQKRNPIWGSQGQARLV